MSEKTMTLVLADQTRRYIKADGKFTKAKKERDSIKFDYEECKKKLKRIRKRLEKLNLDNVKSVYLRQEDGTPMAKLEEKETVVVDGEKKKVREKKISKNDYAQLDVLFREETETSEKMEELEQELKKSDKKMKKKKSDKKYYEEIYDRTSDIRGTAEHYNRYVRPATVVDDPDWWLEEIPAVINRLSNSTNNGKESARLFRQAAVLLSEVDTRDMDKSGRAAFSGMCRSLYACLTNGIVKIKYLTDHAINIFDIVCSETQQMFDEDILSVYTKAKYRGLFKGTRQKWALNRIAKANRKREDRASYSWKYFEKQKDTPVTGKDLGTYTQMKDFCFETSKKSGWEKFKQWLFDFKEAIFTTLLALGSSMLVLLPTLHTPTAPKAQALKAA